MCESLNCVTEKPILEKFIIDIDRLMYANMNDVLRAIFSGTLNITLVDQINEYL